MTPTIGRMADNRAMVRIWSETADNPGVVDTDVTLKPEDVPALVAAQLRDSMSFVVTRDDGRVVHYERIGDWS